MLEGPPSSQRQRPYESSASSSSQGSQARRSRKSESPGSSVSSVDQRQAKSNGRVSLRDRIKSRAVEFLGYDEDDDVDHVLERAAAYVEPEQTFNALDIAQTEPEEIKEKKARKPIAKIDAARMNGPNGFKALRKQCRGWKFQGKGHEMADLNTLLSHYQLWAHQLLPKTTFMDTVERIEKICRGKEMQNTLAELRRDDELAKEQRARDFTREPTANVQVRMIGNEREYGEDEMRQMLAERAADTASVGDKEDAMDDDLIDMAENQEAFTSNGLFLEDNDIFGQLEE